MTNLSNEACGTQTLVCPRFGIFGSNYLGVSTYLGINCDSKHFLPKTAGFAFGKDTIFFYRKQVFHSVFTISTIHCACKNVLAIFCPKRIST
jgi:hypothetical protein